MLKRHKLLLVLFSSILVLSGCGSKEAEDADSTEVTSKTSIEVMEVGKKDISNSYLYSGKAQASSEVNVSGTVQGKVVKVNYKIGNSVNAGDVLYVMDTEDIINSKKVAEASLASAEASIKSAQTSLDLANGASMQSQIEGAKTSLQNAEIAYNTAKTDFENNKVLYDSGIIAKSVFDQYQDAYSMAEISYNQAKKSYDLIVNEMPAENIRRAQDTLNSALAAKESVLAQINSYNKSLNDANVKSPISGVVTACNVEEGEMLSTALVPFTISDNSKINMEVSISEQIINSVNVDDTVSVKMSTLPDESIEGRIATINPAANAGGTYDVKIEISNEDGKVKPGMFGEVSFVKEKSENAIVIPRDAVISKNDETYVFIYKDGKASKVTIEKGIDNGEEVEITKGLEEKMQLIVKGQSYLEDGAEVEVSQEAKGE